MIVLPFILFSDENVSVCCLIAYWYVIFAAFRQSDKALVRTLYAELWKNLREQLKFKKSSSPKNTPYFSFNANEIDKVEEGILPPLSSFAPSKENQNTAVAAVNKKFEVPLPTEGCLNLYIFSQPDYAVAMNALNDYVNFFYGSRPIYPMPFSLMMRRSVATDHLVDLLVLYKTMRRVTAFDVEGYAPLLQTLKEGLASAEQLPSGSAKSQEGKLLLETKAEIRKAVEELIKADVAPVVTNKSNLKPRTRTPSAQNSSTTRSKSSHQ